MIRCYLEPMILELYQLDLFFVAFSNVVLSLYCMLLLGCPLGLPLMNLTYLRVWVFFVHV